MLVVRSLPNFAGGTINVNNEDYKIDLDNEVPPMLVMKVEKGQTVDIVFKNSSSGMMAAKFKHIFYHAQVRTATDNTQCSTPTKLSKKGKRGVFSKLTWSGKKRKPTASLLPPPQVKIVEKIKLVEKEVHLEKREKTTALFEGFLFCFLLTVVAVLLGLKTRHLSISID